MAAGKVDSTSAGASIKHCAAVRLVGAAFLTESLFVEASQQLIPGGRQGADALLKERSNR